MLTSSFSKISDCLSGNAVNQLLEWARSRQPLTGGYRAVHALIILSLWLMIVTFTVTKHEFRRDEVRAFSLASSATSLVDLPHAIENEGHPLLWYLLLYLGNAVANTPLVLPIVSVSIAFAASAVFLILSPFQVWIRCLFIFSMPAYEYSVMARNYGISVLLLFTAAALFRHRKRHPFFLATTLALLANTNAHSVILSSLVLALWAWEEVFRRRIDPIYKSIRAFCLPFLIVLAGVLLCVISCMPKAPTIVTSAFQVSKEKIVYSILDAALYPGLTFERLTLSADTPILLSILIYLVLLGLVSRPELLLASFGASLGFGVLFRLVYPGGYRHQGLFLAFILFLYWLFVESKARGGAISKNGRFFYRLGMGTIAVLLVFNLARTSYSVVADISKEKSSNKAFGRFLCLDETYRDAIIVPEPDYLLESLPYYANNMIYLPRERRFSKTASFTVEARRRLSLGEMLSMSK